MSWDYFHLRGWRRGTSHHVSFLCYFVIYTSIQILLLTIRINSLYNYLELNIFIYIFYEKYNIIKNMRLDIYQGGVLYIIKTINIFCLKYLIQDILWKDKRG